MHLNKNRELGGVNNFPAVALYTGYILPNSRRVQGPPRCPISSVDRQRMLLMGLKRKLQLLVAKKRPSLEQLRILCMSLVTKCHPDIHVGQK